MGVVGTLFGQPLLVLFAIVGAGMAVGRVRLGGVSLGSSGVLFVGLVAGHFGLQIPAGMGTLGLVLFVYCVGIGAGGSLMSVLAHDGSKIVRLALVIVVTGAVLVWGLAQLLHIPGPLAGGIFAGALTSTPAFAAARDAVADTSRVAVGYGIAYPFGVASVVLFVQVMPRFVRGGREALEKAAEEVDLGNAVETTLVEVTNANLMGKRISESGIARFNACQVSRVLRAGRLVPIQYDEVFEPNQQLLLVGRPNEIAIAVGYLGRISDERYVKDVETERQRLVVTDRTVIGQTLRQIRPLKDHGVIVTRITRHDITFVPNADVALENHDILLAVGEPKALTGFATFIGHKTRAFDETDLLSLAVGLILGIIVGSAPFGLPGGKPMTLGMAGGPLLVALVLGHFGKVGGLVGYIPRGTRLALQELGLVLFLAEAGVEGGRDLVHTVSEFGSSVHLLALVASTGPITVGYIVARKILKLDLLQSLGGVCGGATSTPALGVLSSRTESTVPTVSYAAAYPIALVAMTFLARALVELLGTVT